MKLVYTSHMTTSAWKPETEYSHSVKGGVAREMEKKPQTTFPTFSFSSSLSHQFSLFTLTPCYPFYVLHRKKKKVGKQGSSYTTSKRRNTE